MLTVVTSISSLLLGAALLLVGNGLIGTLLALRASAEGFSDGVIGLIMSAYFVGFLSGTWVAPRAVMRVGHIRAFAMFAAVASAAAILHALIVDPLAWGALRVLVGSCLVGLYMVIESWLNVLAPGERRGKVFATYMAVNFIALAIGQNLIRLYPPTGFELFGIVAMLLALSLVPIAATRISQPAPVRQPRVRLRRLYAASPSAIIGAFGSGLAMSAFWGLGPVMAQRLGFDAGGIAALMTATILGGAVIQWPVGAVSDRHDRRVVLAAVMALACTFALLAFAMSALGLWPLLVAMFVFGGLAFTVYPVSIALANDFLAPEEILQGASSMLLVHGIGAAIGPTLAGLLMDLAGPRGLLLHFALIHAALTALVWWRYQRSGTVNVPQAHFEPMIRTSPAALEMIAPETPAAADAPTEPRT
ncbi:MFS transporter [Sinimarinibacterium thermocellulolyticum]|uniref:MFS transporter n=1 Tax=Sinimarinibacterium thermocellulolyticum TaxID=3170016 RepID=A0ABV2ABJ9_9GAMM